MRHLIVALSLLLGATNTAQAGVFVGFGQSGGNQHLPATGQIEFAAGTASVDFKLIIYDAADSSIVAVSQAGVAVEGAVTVTFTSADPLVTGHSYYIGVISKNYGADVLYSASGAAGYKDTGATFASQPDPGTIVWAFSGRYYNILIRNGDNATLLGQLDGTDIQSNIPYDDAILSGELEY